MGSPSWFVNIACLMSLAMVVAACGSGAVPLETRASSGPSPTVEAPAYAVGDEWHYTNGTILRVVALDGDSVVTSAVVPSAPQTNCPDCRQFRDRNFTVVRIVDKAGVEVQAGTIGLKALDFPMQVGKKWSFRLDLRQISTGQLMPYDNSFAVEAYEQVKTKAGVFNAYRVAYLQENKGPYSWSGRATLWYSPEVKAYVKRIAHTRDFLGDWELESYSLK